MKYELMLRSRANPRESIEAKHKKFLARLREIPHPWGVAGQELPPRPDCGTDTARSTKLSKRLGNGLFVAKQFA